MAKLKAKKSWTQNDYKLEAQEWIACYGADHCWDEFVYEYVGSWDRTDMKAPDPDLMIDAIYTAKRGQ